MSSEKFCLRWNDFESNISGAFRELRDEKDFFDVTIACEDEQIQEHKVILSACSPYFPKHFEEKSSPIPAAFSDRSKVHRSSVSPQLHVSWRRESSTERSKLIPRSC